MAPVFAKLDRLGIEPLGAVPEEVDPVPMIEGLRRRAEAIRQKWLEERLVSEDEAVSLDPVS